MTSGVYKLKLTIYSFSVLIGVGNKKFRHTYGISFFSWKEITNFSGACSIYSTTELRTNYIDKNVRANMPVIYVKG